MFDYSREEILASLGEKTRHETLALTEEKKKSIISNPLLKKNLSDLEECRKHYRDFPLYSIPFSLFRRYEADGDRTQYEYADKGYFIHRGHLETWTMAAALYGEKEDIAMLEDTIWAVCDEYTWALPAHMNGSMSLYSCLQKDRYTIDLFAAETGDTVSEALFLLGDKLDPIVRKRALRELDERIFDRYLTGKGDFWWETCTNNWAAVCAGSVGMAALCAIDDNEKLADIIVRTLAPLRTFMSGFSDDGACLEGIGYWHYGFGYFCNYADMLYRRTGGKIDLFKEEKVHLVATFPQKIFFYGSRTISFSDGGSGSSLSLGMTSMLMSRYDDIRFPPTVRLSGGPGHSNYDCHRFAPAFHSLIWAPDTMPADSEKPGIYPLPAAQWYVANGKNDFGFAAKAGNNAEPHNHNDIGQFIIFKKGEEFFCDLGSGEYSKQYFGKERYTFLHNGSHGHSVPIIDGVLQSAGRDFRATDVVVNESGISMDMAGAYPAGTAKHIYRRYVFDPETSEVTMKDRFVFENAPGKIVERFISKLVPEVSDGKITIRTANNSAELTFDQALFNVKVDPVTVPNHSGIPFTVYLTDLEFKETGTEVEAVFGIR